MSRILVFVWLGLVSTLSCAAELAGIYLADEIKTEDGQTLLLNGAGLREKLWVDVYVGSLYLSRKSGDVAEILSNPGPWRIQLDFIYKEVARKKILDSWREGFQRNQPAESLNRLQSRINQFYEYFQTSTVAGDQYWFDYFPGKGVRINKNGQQLGLIPGEDFKNALLEIWLGNHPADKTLKKGLLGLE